MEGYRTVAELATRKRRAVVTSDARTNVIAVRFGKSTSGSVDFGSCWYHAAAIQDEQLRPPKV